MDDYVYRVTRFEDHEAEFDSIYKTLEGAMNSQPLAQWEHKTAGTSGYEWWSGSVTYGPNYEIEREPLNE